MNLSVSLLLDSSPDRGALGKEVSFSMGLVAFAGKHHGMPKPPLLGEVASSKAKMTERFRLHKNKSPTPGVFRCGGAGMESGNVFQLLLSQKTTTRVLPP